MITLTETIYVKTCISDAFNRLKQFDNIALWDPSVESAGQLSKGPVVKGTRFRITLRMGLFRPQMTYRTVRCSPWEELVFRGDGGSFAATDIIRLKQAGNRTRIDYTAHLFFRWLPEEFEPALAPLMREMGRNSVLGLKQWLDAFSGSVPLSAKPGFIDRLADQALLPGLLGFTRLGHALISLARPAPLPSMAGKTVLITGATSGIGRAAAEQLARLGARVLFVARNREKARAVRLDLMEKSGNSQVDFLLADLGRLGEIRKLIRALVKRHTPLDVLINNAGALFSHRSETGKGLEKTFAVNLLGPFYLTEQLLANRLIKARARIINVSSGGMYTQGMDLNDLENNSDPWNGPKAYARAKRGLAMLTRLWAEQLAPRGIRVHAMHPGWVDTPGIQKALPRFHSLTRPVLRTPAQGADTIVWLASALEPGNTTGGFWLDRRRHSPHVFPGTRDNASLRRDLYDRLQSYTPP